MENENSILRIFHHLTIHIEHLFILLFLLIMKIKNVDYYNEIFGYLVKKKNYVRNNNTLTKQQQEKANINAIIKFLHLRAHIAKQKNKANDDE